MRSPVLSPRAAFLSWLLVGAVVLAGCSKPNDSNEAPQQNAAAAGDPQPPPEAPPPPPTEDAAAWSPSALDELLAPVALYPDTILAQVLAASTNTQEVLDAGNWLLDHQSLEGDALTKEAAAADFSPSVQALVHFPTVVDMMCRELDWTRQLGDAFSADQSAVLASVQRLRTQAQEAGNLKSSPQMMVEKTTTQGTDAIEIKPADPKVIYVPQYNPTQVYTPPPVTTTTTTTTGITTEQAVVGGLLAFGAGILVANLFDDNHNDHYYPYPNWGYGGVYYGPRPYYPHNTFVYAPRYPGYRPAPYYRPPASYPHRYNNYNHYGNTNVNVNVNNSKNYFNRFDKNQNRVPGYKPRSPVAPGANPTAYRGQSTYNGANRPRPNSLPQAAPRTARPPRAGAQPVPKGAYQGARTAASQAPHPAGFAQRPTSGVDRGYPKASGSRRDASAETRPRASSFSGAGQQQGAMDRAASARGRASMKSAPRPSTSMRQTHAPQRSAPRARQQ